VKNMEIDLLETYPKITRDTKSRSLEKTPRIIQLAKKFGWEYFDKKGVCYNGYSYDRRWIPVVKKFIDYYDLHADSKVLDIGCGKGYLVYDFIEAGIDCYGIDVSNYAIDCSPPEIRWRLKLRNAKDLGVYKDDQFDLVISINTIHNLKEPDCRKAIRDIQRIGKHAFIVVDSFRNDIEKQRMMEWNTTGETIKSTEEWKKTFDEEGYVGDYYWFIP